MINFEYMFPIFYFIIFLNVQIFIMISEAYHKFFNYKFE